MILALVFAAMALIAVGFVVLPLIRRAPKADSPARADYDIAIYKDQLRDIERDRSRGVLDESQATAARLEVERRLLAAADASQSTSHPVTAPQRAPWALVVVVALVLLPGAGLIYLQNGAPWLAGAERAAQRSEPSFDDLIAELEHRLAERPDDGRGWVLLARGYARQGRVADALKAQQRAMALASDDKQAADIAAGFGQVLIEQANGTVTPQASAAFADALKHNPAQPQARYFTGLAKAQAGDKDGALQDWHALLAASPADAPWRAGLQAQIAQLETGAAPDAAAGQQAMIEGMVAKLAARLAEEKKTGGGTAAEWAQLGRSYRVLGRAAESRDAYGEAVKRAPDDVALLSDYAAAVGAADGQGSPAYRDALTKLRDRLPMGSQERAAVEDRLKALP
jgi:cytochrome c-type biogenesis protein CcmH